MKWIDASRGAELMAEREDVPANMLRSTVVEMMNDGLLKYSCCSNLHSPFLILKMIISGPAGSPSYEQGYSSRADNPCWPIHTDSSDVLGCCRVSILSLPLDHFVFLTPKTCNIPMAVLVHLFSFCYCLMHSDVM